MTDRELRKLHREDLLQILIAQQTQIDDLNAALEEKDAALKDKSIALEESGSIAEAALRLSGVFTSAQDAADRYVEETRKRAEAQAEEILEKAREEARLIVSGAWREAGIPEPKPVAPVVDQPQPQEPAKRRGGLFRRKG